LLSNGRSQSTGRNLAEPRPTLGAGQPGCPPTAGLAKRAGRLGSDTDGRAVGTEPRSGVGAHRPWPHTKTRIHKGGGLEEVASALERCVQHARFSKLPRPSRGSRAGRSGARAGLREETPGPPSPGPTRRPEHRRAREGGLRRKPGNRGRPAGSLRRGANSRRYRPGVRSRGASSKDPSSFAATPVARRLESGTIRGTDSHESGRSVRGISGSGVSARHVGDCPARRGHRRVGRGAGQRGRRRTPHGITERPPDGGRRFGRSMERER
jgi:hypothetical protein